MNLEQQNILFFTRTMKLGGTEKVVLQLCEILKPHVNKIIVCSCGGNNVGVLCDMGIKHYEIPDIESKSPNTIVTVSKRLLFIIRNEKITVIHTHHRMAAFYVALLGLYKKCVFLNTCHNTFTNKRSLTRFSYKHANLIACGEMVKKNLVDFFNLPESQITVIHNAVKPFEGPVVRDPLIELLHKEGYFLIANIGRLSEQKGMEYYIQAVSQIVEKYPNTRFLIVGSGEDEHKLKDLVNSLKIDTYVIFMGYRTDVQNVMSQVDLVVLSSLWEGLPLTPIEAFSVGKTIVATAVDGTTEIVKDGENGLLVEPKNCKQMAEKIVWIMDNFQQKELLENNALLTYQEEYSISKLVNSYIKHYRMI